MIVSSLHWLHYNSSVSTTPSQPQPLTTNSTSPQIWTWHDWSVVWCVSTGFILLIRATSSDLTQAQSVQLNLLLNWLDLWLKDTKHCQIAGIILQELQPHPPPPTQPHCQRYRKTLIAVLVRLGFYTARWVVSGVMKFGNAMWTIDYQPRFIWSLDFQVMNFLWQ